MTDSDAQPGDSLADADWLQDVFERYEGPLVRYAHRLLRDADRARDVVQDTFLRLCRQEEPRLKLGSGVAAWLYAVCRNRALDVCKKEHRMNPLSDQQAEARPGLEPDPAIEAQTREASRQALHLLQALPENQQEVVRLKIEHSLSYREIAEVTGLTVSNVGYLLHHGLKTIRQQMRGSEIV